MKQEADFILIHDDDADVGGVCVVSLPADFIVWVAGEEAAFLAGKFVFANWDIDELKARKEEIRAGVVRQLGGKEQNDYIVVRNHILARWRSNVEVWLSKGQIKETVSNEYEHLISSAYDFLLYNGYINFGVLLPLTSPMPELTNEGSVIIVGAGLAGLSAAKQLMSFGFKVIVLEGRNRPGGRVYTQKMGKKGQFAAVDLGGSVITGIKWVTTNSGKDKTWIFVPQGWHSYGIMRFLLVVLTRGMENSASRYI